MIVETVVTTLDEDGQANFAAMGVVWGEDRLVIRPYAAPARSGTWSAPARQS